jgi:hypothetical protein
MCSSLLPVLKDLENAAASILSQTRTPLPLQGGVVLAARTASQLS